MFLIDLQSSAQPNKIFKPKKFLMLFSLYLTHWFTLLVKQATKYRKIVFILNMKKKKQIGETYLLFPLGAKSQVGFSWVDLNTCSALHTWWGRCQGLFF